MICTICKIGQMKRDQVTVTLHRDQTVIVIKNVPASVCENCGEYSLSEEVTKEVMKRAEFAVANNAEVEILQYAA